MKTSLIFVFITAAGLVAGLQADVLKLTDGPAVQGTLVSANSRDIVFLGVDGATRSYSIDRVSRIDFAPLPPPPAPKPAPAAAPADVLTVPAGTQITVRTIEAIQGDSAKAGARFRASIDEPVMVGSKTAIPKGSGCTVEVISVEQGKELALRLRDVTIGGKAYGTSTAYAQVEATGTSKGKTAARRGVGLGALGAGIGAIAGGGKGAAIGAAVGAGVGAVSAAGAKGKTLAVPSETRLIFALSAQLPMN